MKKKIFSSDHRRDNPNLHMLYVKTAVRHLTMVDRMVKELYEESNWNATLFAEALSEKRDHMVESDAAYADADEMIRQLRRAEAGMPARFPEEVTPNREDHDA